MGAAASVESTQVSAEDVAEAVKDTANKLDDGLAQINMPELPPAVVVPDLNIQSRIENIGAAVGVDQRVAVLKMLQDSKNSIPTGQMASALEEIERALPTAQGAAILVTVAGSVTSASNMAPEIVALIGKAVLSLGEHLPYIGVAAGAIGAILYTFRLTKEQNKDIETVTTWLLSVKDWLMLVAEKVTGSSVSSTTTLFQALQDAILNISTQMDERNRKWRITQMLSATQFKSDFARAKTAVLELKTALRDFLDEETQNRQEAILASIASAQIETIEKLNSIETDLSLIKELLEAKLEDQAKNDEKAKTYTVEVRDDEEAIYSNIQRAAGTNGEPEFKHFVNMLESSFYKTADMPPEQKRAFKISILNDGDSTVSKPAWIKFFRRWTSSGLNLEQYLVNVAEANPTLYQKGLKMRADAVNRAKVALASQGINNVDDLKRKANEKMNSMGINLSFGKNKEVDAVAAAV